MILTGINLLGLHQEPVRRNRDYTHKYQLTIYGSKKHKDQFVKCSRFKRNMVRVLTDLIHKDIEPRERNN